jgi:hypothetical protein
MAMSSHAVSVILLAATGFASAGRIDLTVYENDDGADTTGLDLWVDVVDAGPFVDFVFHNESTISGFVTSVYFEDRSAADSLTAGSVFDQSSGVRFSEGATPGSPAGSIDAFGGDWAGELFDADADNPGPRWGIHVDETLTVRFELVGGASYSDVLADLQSANGMRIAQHVQGLGDSSVWTTNDVHVNPLPSAAAMGIGGLGLVMGGRRRRVR